MIERSSDKKDDEMHERVIRQMRWVRWGCLLLAVGAALGGCWLACGVWLLQAVMVSWQVRLIDRYVGRGR